jgi:hypothetical protein
MDRKGQGLNVVLAEYKSRHVGNFSKQIIKVRLQKELSYAIDFRYYSILP